MSVLQQPEAVSPDFADQVDDILAMLDGSYRVERVSTCTRCPVKEQA